jgi:hypothetical protein
MWLWRTHDACVADGTHQTSKESSLTNLSDRGTEACILEYKKSVPSDCTQEVTACFTSAFAADRLPARCSLVVQRDANHRALDRDSGEGALYPSSRSALTSHKSGWQVICNRRRREASCHLLTTDTRHRFRLHQDSSPIATVRKMINCHWCLSGDLVVPSDTYVMYTSSSK